MAEPSVRELYLRFVDAMSRKDWQAVAACLHPEYVEEYPQSGELVRGPENAIAIRRDYPGMAAQERDLESVRFVGDEGRWAVTPAFTVVRIEGTDGTFTGVMKVRYPDQSEWFAVALMETKGGLLWRSTVYFAPMFEAPEWRRQWVERTAA